ncbi:SET domain-containing protein [Mucor ambiguus]|uniref:SET domain-containing protein n=1 Tax=Mucor ambiguus TaxID=91626 RepID=A0A0C9M0C5_9FUNG|nr:SET domain-containing protein [Mucor ambiguus]
MEDFLAWAKNQCITSTAIIKKTPHAGYGLFATQDSCSNPVHIPSKALLSSQKAIQVEPFAAALRALYVADNLDQVPHTHEKQVLCLFLIYCQFFDNATDWRPYMDILPSIDFFKQNHLLFNLHCLQGTSLENSTRAKLNKLRRELEEINQTKSSWLSKVDIDMYKWADCVFWSRVVGIGGAFEETDAAHTSNMVMIPYFDFANHSVDRPNMRWQPTSDGGIDLVTYPDMVKEGDELLLSYGSKPNQELLFLHGFCVENNPNPSCFTLPVAPFLHPEADPLNMPKIHWLQQCGVKPTLTLSQSSKNTNLMDIGWSPESIQLMYLVVMDEDNGLHFGLNEQENVELYIGGQKVTTLDTLEQMTNDIDLLPVIQLRVIMLLIDALQYQYSANTEHAILDDTPIGEQALIYRNEEKSLLESALQTLTKLSNELMQNPIVVEYLKNAQ